MRKRIGILLLALLLLAGCGSRSAEAPAGAEAADRSLPAAEEAAPPEVENNGGHYVRVGGRVYFRRYGPDALEKAAVFGQFTEAGNAGFSGESELMAYDPADGALTALYTECGAGPLWYADGGFYLSEYANGSEQVVWYDADGGKIEPLCEGGVLGATDGGLLAVERVAAEPTFHTEYAFYRNKTLLGQSSTEDGVHLIGLTDDGAFLLCSSFSEDGKGTFTVWQFTPDGKQLRLGVLPPAEEPAFTWSVEPVRFLPGDGKVALGVGYYAGTGHFLDRSVFLEADVGTEDSLRLLPGPESGAEDEELPYLARGAEGAVEFVSAPDGTLRVNWDEPYALQLREDGAWQTLADRFAPYPEDGWGFRKIPQHTDYVGGAAYVTLACAEASPADSVGWRDGYALLDMLYLKVDRDGTVTELCAVDHNAELFGKVWFIEGESTAIWQQLSSADGEGYFEGNYAYAIPIAEDAYWEGGWEKVWDGVTGLLPYDYGEDGADYYGCPVPDAEPAGELCLTLDRNGTAVSLSRKDPAAVLGIDFDVPEESLEGAAATLDPERRPGDEDAPRFWAKLRVLEDGVRVRLERSSERLNTTERMAASDGVFFPGETLYDGVLDRGDFLAVRVSLPWRPELRVSVSKDGGWGSYCFGEDNHLHLETEKSVHPELTLAAYPAPAPDGFGEDAMLQALAGDWLYRSPVTDEVTGLLRVGADGAVTVTNRDGESFSLTAAPGRLYVPDWDAPDILTLSAEDPAVTERIGFGPSAGDYLPELFRTDGEELLRLTQTNNGDGALEFLLPDDGAPRRSDYVFTRSRGAAEKGVPERGLTFPAVVAKYDAEKDIYWLRRAEIVDFVEDAPVYRAVRSAPCVAYDAGGARLPQGSRDTDRPMALCLVTVNAEGAAERFEAIEK